MIVLLDIYGVIIREPKAYNYLLWAFKKFGLTISKGSLKKIWYKTRIGNWDMLDVVGIKIYDEFIKLHEENPGFRHFLNFLEREKIDWGILSNIDERTYETLKRKFGWNPTYEIVSSRLGVMKPDPIIFEHARKVVGKDFILVDNNPRNVNVIMRLGIKAILFRGFDNLIKKIREYFAPGGI